MLFDKSNAAIRRMIEIKYHSYIIDLFLIIIAFAASLTFAPFFKERFKNPYDISNPYSTAGFNPDNNYLYLLSVITLTIVIYYLLRYLYAKKFYWLVKLFVIGLLLINFFLIDSLPSPGFTTGPKGLDNFHSGEILSPASAFLSGKKPYEEIVFLRGAGVDTVIPSLSFITTGKSIGSLILQIDNLRLLSILSFLLLLAFLIKDPLRFTLASTLFYISNAVSLIDYRDIFVWTIFGLILLAFKENLPSKNRALLLFVVGFVSSITLYIAIDRGVLLFALALMLCLSLLVVKADKKNQFFFSPRTLKDNYLSSLYVLGGMVTGLLAPVPLIGLDGFFKFLELTFIEIPRYGGLLVSQPFPDFYSDRFLIWGPVLLAIASVLLYVSLAKNWGKEKLNSLLPLGIFIVFGILCIKAGANRIDLTKMASVITPLFLAAALLVTYAIKIFREQKDLRQTIAFPLILTCAVMLFFAQLNFGKLLFQPDYTRPQLAAYKNIYKTPDDVWLSDETIQVRNYITENTQQSEYIFAFTSNPIYYYLTQRQNPSRFYVSWFADPQPFTSELLAALKKNSPKIIIYEEKTSLDQPDGVPMQVRIPEVDSWIRANYKKHITIGSTTLLEK